MIMLRLNKCMVLYLYVFVQSNLLNTGNSMVFLLLLFLFVCWQPFNEQTKITINIISYDCLFLVFFLFFLVFYSYFLSFLFMPPIYMYYQIKITYDEM